MIRRAKFVDIPRLSELMAEMHTRSRYAAVSDIDMGKVRSILTQSIQRDGGTAAGSTHVMVATDKDDVATGFIIGILTPIYDVGTQLLCTDWIFYVSDDGDARDAMRLLDSVIAWADANPRVSVQRFGVTDAIGDPARAGRMYERRGFRLAGAIYERTTGEAMEVAA